MEYKYETILRAKEKITKTLQELGLTLLDPKYTVEKAISREERFYMSVCLDNQGKEYFFKARLQNTEELWISLKKEIEFGKKISPLIYSRKTHFLVPNILKTNYDREGFLWLLRNYHQGEFAGSMDVDLSIKKEFLEKYKPSEFAHRVLSYQNTTSKAKKEIFLHHHGYYWYSCDYEYYKNTRSLKFFIPYQIEKMGYVFKENKHYLDQYANTLCHGDLYPNNILLTPENNVLLIDWELINLNNSGFDFAFIWMNAFQSPDWQKKFIKAIMKKVIRRDLFKKSFRLSCLSLSLRFLRACRIAHTSYEAGYLEQMKRKGYPLEQIHGIKEKALEGEKIHLKTLELALNKPKKII